MGRKLSIVSDSSENPEKLRINVADKKIYYEDVSGNIVVLVEGSLGYRPLHCSEFHNRLANRNWNKSETLFISGVDGESNEDDPILRYRKYTNPENKPTGEIDEIDITSNNSDLSFPLCGDLNDETRERVFEFYENLFDATEGAHEEVCFMGSSKDVINTSDCQESISLVKGFDSYTNSVDLNDLIEYSSYPGTSARVDISIRYSKINDEESVAYIYNYFTTFKAFWYNENRELIIEDTIETISDDTDDLVRIEYLGGIIKVFPVSPMVSECIINDCTIIYGNLR